MYRPCVNGNANLDVLPQRHWRAYLSKTSCGFALRQHTPAAYFTRLSVVTCQLQTARNWLCNVANPRRNTAGVGCIGWSFAIYALRCGNAYFCTEKSAAFIRILSHFQVRVIVWDCPSQDWMWSAIHGRPLSSLRRHLQFKQHFILLPINYQSNPKHMRKNACKRFDQVTSSLRSLWVRAGKSPLLVAQTLFKTKIECRSTQFIMVNQPATTLTKRVCGHFPCVFCPPHKRRKSYDTKREVRFGFCLIWISNRRIPCGTLVRVAVASVNASLASV